MGWGGKSDRFASRSSLVMDSMTIVELLLSYRWQNIQRGGHSVIIQDLLLIYLSNNYSKAYCTHSHSSGPIPATQASASLHRWSSLESAPFHPPSPTSLLHLAHSRSSRTLPLAAAHRSTLVLEGTHSSGDSLPAVRVFLRRCVLRRAFATH